jgi:hypothetical protein
VFKKEYHIRTYLSAHSLTPQKRKKEKKGIPRTSVTNERRKKKLSNLIDSSHLTLSRERERQRERERGSRFLFSFFPGGAKRERERDGRVALGFEKRERGSLELRG